MRRTFIVCLALLAAGCGGKSNTKVTDQGNTLAPSSAVSFSATAVFISIGGVLVTDVTDLCSVISKSSSTSNACNSSGSPLNAPGDATSLAIAVIPAGEGKFNILQQQTGSSSSDGGASFTIPTGAVVSFQKVQGNKTVFQDEAVSGTVQIDHFKAGDSASGSYDVVMKSGAHLQGDFSGSDCPALDAELTSASTSDRSCSTSASGGTCSASCSCGGKTVSASCSQEPDAGAWNCSCTDGSGASTTCTSPAATASFDACSQGTGCCPLTF